MGKIGRQGSFKQKWIPKGEAKEEEEAEPEVVAPVTGEKVYDKVTMLQILRICKKDAGKESAGGADSADGRLLAKDRPPPEDGGRRGPREQKEKLRKGASAEFEVDPSQGAGWGGINSFLAEYVKNMTSMAGSGMQGTMYNSCYTTVMLRNIPNRYTRKTLLEQLDKDYAKMYDFVYLPIDFNSECNVGYAFINFRTPAAAMSFIQQYHQKETRHVLPLFDSKKVCEVGFARVQGRDQNMENLRDDSFINKLQEKPDWQPLFYDEQHKEIDFKETLGAGGGRKRGSRSSGSMSMPAASPTHAQTPTGGFMMPTPFGPMMHPGFMPFGAPMAPPMASMSLQRVLPEATAETMLRLKGIPTAWTTKRILEKLSEWFKGSLDFLFVPPDPKGESKNRGYCFVNFRTAAGVEKFKEMCHDKPVTEVFEGASEPPEQVCQVEPGRFVNIEKSIVRAQASARDGKSAEKSEGSVFLFDTDGKTQPFPNLSQQVPATPMDMAQIEAARMTPKAGGKGGKGGKASPSPSSMGMMGFPGFFPSPTAGASLQQQQQAAIAQVHAARSQFFAMQAQHFQAAAQALQNEQVAAAAKHTRARGTPLAAPQKAALRTQIEYYFSVDNLHKDTFLRGRMDGDGWVPLELIATFKKVSQCKATVAELAEIVSTSDVVETDPTKCNVRLKDADLRAQFARAPSEMTPAAAGQASAS